MPSPSYTIEVDVNNIILCNTRTLRNPSDIICKKQKALKNRNIQSFGGPPQENLFGD
jgi:hypothetical protein